MQAIKDFFLNYEDTQGMLKSILLALGAILGLLGAMAGLIWVVVQIYGKVKEFHGMNENKKLHSPSKARIANLPHRNPHFTGREETLVAMEIAFKENSALALTQTISGLGGVGKSQTVLEYAYRHLDDYDVIWWVNAESALANNCLELLHRYDILKDKEDPTAQEIQAELRSWYDNHSSWLLVFDNAEDYNKLKPYFPATTKGHVLITTRDINLFRSISKQVDLDVFPIDTALSFLQERTGYKPDDHANVLVEQLGCLPLALEQAAAYMEITKKDYSEYLALLHRYGLELLKKGSPVDYKKVVTTTWTATQGNLSPAAKLLLGMCAFLAPDKIPMQIFVDAIEAEENLTDFLQNSTELHVPENLLRMMLNELDRDSIISELTQYSLLKRDEKGFYSMHRLVQQVVRHNIGENTTCLVADLYLIVAVLPERYKDGDALVRFNSIAKHAVAVLGYASNVVNVITGDNEKLMLITKGFKRLSDGYWWCGKYDESRDNAEKAATFGEKAYGPNHQETADAYTNLALAYRKLDKLEISLELHNKALAIYMITPDQWQPAIASTYNYLGTLYRILHDYERAETMNKMALSIFENLDPSKSSKSSIASTYCNLGDLYGEMQNQAEALVMYEEARVIYEEIFEEGHAYTARSYNSIGDAYHNIGNYENALKMYEKALDIDHKFYGLNHPTTAMTYSSLGKLYTDMKKPKQALEMHQKALTIRLQTLGANHPYTQASQTRVQNAVASIGRKGKKKAIEIG